MKKHIIKESGTTIIQIPHLRTQVVVKKYKKGWVDDKGKSLDDADGYTTRLCPEEYTMTLKLPVRGKKTASNVVHEIIHILQYIVEDNSMDFTREREHLAYIAGYLFMEICNI